MKDQTHKVHEIASIAFSSADPPLLEQKGLRRRRKPVHGSKTEKMRLKGDHQQSHEVSSARFSEKNSEKPFLIVTNSSTEEDESHHSDEPLLEQEGLWLEPLRGYKTEKKVFAVKKDPKQTLKANHTSFSDDSLLSAWSSSEEDESLDSDCRGLKRVHERFRIRDRTLRRISWKKGPVYQKMLLQMELASRKHYLQERAKCGSISASSRVSENHNNNKNDNNNLPSSLLFECHHLPEGIWGVLLFCVGDLALACSIDRGSKAGVILTGTDPYVVHAIQIVVCLMVMRLNGYMWWWLGKDSYNLVKFDLHNRVELGYWDARLMKALQSNPRLRRVNGVLNLLSLYGAYMGVYFFYIKALDKWELMVWDWYKEECDVADFPVDDDANFEVCDRILAELKPSLKRAVMHHICTDPEDWSFLTGGYHASILMVAMVFSYVTGASMLEVEA